MNPLAWLNPGGTQVEFVPRGLRVLHRGRVREWSFEREANGAIKEVFAARIREELPAWLEHKPWQPRRAVSCALPAGGVSLRRVKVPRSEGDVLERVLRLQIESGFPLGPDELAWGWQALGVVGDLQEVLLAAVKREGVAEWQTLLHACGLEPSFTLGALARAGLAEASFAGSFLHFGSEQTECLFRDALGPQRLRVLPWGEQSIRREFVVHAGLTPESAGAVLDAPDGSTPDDSVRRVVEAAVDSILAWVPASSLGANVRISGRLAQSALFRSAFVRRLGTAVACSPLESNSSGVGDATLRGMERLGGISDGATALRLAHRPAEGVTLMTRPAPRRWAMAAGGCLLALVLLPYAEALLLQPGLAARVAAIKKRQDDLRLIDQQSDFLRYLKQNQAPYLDTLAILGKCSAPGTKIDSFSLTRKGELSLRVTVRQPQEAADFRTKLTDSGLFASVVIEEQSPAQNRQQFMVRLSAQVKSFTERAGLKMLQPEPLPAGSTNKIGSTNMIGSTNNAAVPVVATNPPAAKPAEATKK